MLSTLSVPQSIFDLDIVVTFCYELYQCIQPTSNPSHRRPGFIRRNGRLLPPIRSVKLVIFTHTSSVGCKKFRQIFNRAQLENRWSSNVAGADSDGMGALSGSLMFMTDKEGAGEWRERETGESPLSLPASSKVAPGGLTGRHWLVGTNSSHFQNIPKYL